MKPRNRTLCWVVGGPGMICQSWAGEDALLEEAGPMLDGRSEGPPRWVEEVCPWIRRSETLLVNSHFLRVKIKVYLLYLLCPNQ